MTLGERVRIILNEQKISQVDFSESLGVSANYINLIANGKKDTISETLARLIEEAYGYSKQWILTGEGEKNAIPAISRVKVDMIKKIQKMPDQEVKALIAFANSIAEVKKIYGEMD